MISTIYISAATNKIENQQREYWQKYYCKYYKIEIALIKAFVKKESENGKSLKRFEPHLMAKTNKATEWYRNTLNSKEKKDPFSYYSMGDLQLLFGVMKNDFGYRGTSHELLNPRINYKYGIKYIKWLCKPYKSKKIKMYLREVISSFNQGLVKKKSGKIYRSKYIDTNKNGIKDRWEKWKNEYYVNLVYKYYKKFGGKIK